MHESHLALVVPCYNEEQRIDAEAFLAFARSSRAHLLFVDDGSTDGTARVLADIQGREPDLIQVVTLDRNMGKAEAVRRGLRKGIETGAAVVGYLDADLSTPPDEVMRLVETISADSQVVAAFGCRVARLGARIDRSHLRHYLGRIFATAASLALQIPVYDTQCGAKCFRVSPALRAALDEPFLSRWVFDVEFIGRLLAGSPGVPPVSVDALVEVPLLRWRDVGASKVGLRAMAQSAVDLGRIWRAFRARRRRFAGTSWT